MTQLPRQREPEQEVSDMQFVFAIIQLAHWASSDEEAVAWRLKERKTVFASAIIQISQYILHNLLIYAAKCNRLFFSYSQIR